MKKSQNFRTFFLHLKQNKVTNFKLQTSLVQLLNIFNPGAFGDYLSGYSEKFSANRDQSSSYC